MELKNNLRSKKAEDQSYEEIIFIIINVTFFCLMLFFVFRVSASETVMEEQYAKSLALLIDNIRPGTEITMPVGFILDKAASNNIKMPAILLVPGSGQINITLISGKGYSFPVLTTLKEVSINEHKSLNIKT